MRPVHWTSALALMASGLIGCASETDDLGVLRLALSFEGQRAFEVIVFDGSPNAELSGRRLFESGCVERRSTTLELSALPPSAAYAVVYRAYADAGCAGTPIAFGYRGGISVLDSAGLYVHVPVYAVGEGTLLPADLNISALASTPVDSCAEGGVCAEPRETCVESDRAAWCVPTCDEDADCAPIHPQATCDGLSGWCMLASPYPLNTSEPRALGRAFTRPNGDVVAVAGFAPVEGGGFGKTRFAAEAFDAGAGIFAPVELVGLDEGPAGAFGFAQLGPERAVLAGGATAARGLSLVDGRLSLDVDWATAGVAKVFVMDVARGRAVSAELDTVLADPGVVAVSADRFLVLGGRAPLDGGGAQAATYDCRVSADFVLSCAPGPQLRTARVAPAARCVAQGGDACAGVLIFGGNDDGGDIAELLLLGPDGTTAEGLDAARLPEVIERPVLCQDLIVGGALPRNVLQTLRLDLSEVFDGAISQIDRGDESPGVRLPLHGGHGPDACGASFGGLVGISPNFEASDAAWEIGGADVARAEGTLGRARVGAAVARVGAGPLSGSWVILGGLEPTGRGTEMRAIHGAEVWRP